MVHNCNTNSNNSDVKNISKSSICNNNYFRIAILMLALSLIKNNDFLMIACEKI